MTTAASLTPHTWQPPERNILRAAILTAVEGNFARMAEHLAALSPEALTDLAYALDVMHPNVRELAGIKPMPPYPPGVRHESIKVPCGQCGHDEMRAVHRDGMCEKCPDGRCQPVVVPVPGHVEGWPTGGRAK